MQHPLAVPGFGDHQLVVDTGGFWSGAKLLIDGEPAPKGPKRVNLRFTALMAARPSLNFA